MCPRDHYTVVISIDTNHIKPLVQAMTFYLLKDVFLVNVDVRAVIKDMIEHFSDITKKREIKFGDFIGGLPLSLGK